MSTIVPLGWEEIKEISHYIRNDGDEGVGIVVGEEKN